MQILRTLIDVTVIAETIFPCSNRLLIALRVTKALGIAGLDIEITRAMLGAAVATLVLYTVITIPMKTVDTLALKTAVPVDALGVGNAVGDAT